MVVSRQGGLRRPVRAALACSMVLVGLLIAIGERPAAATPVTSVKGSACGYMTNVGIFGGDQEVLGCGEIGHPPGPNVPASTDDSFSPHVALPADGSGSATALTATDTDGAVGKYGPAYIVSGQWPSDVASPPPTGPLSVSTQGTPGGGTVTSSADIILYQTPQAVQCFGEEPDTANCTAPGGFGPWPVSGDSLHVECSASATEVTGSATFSANAQVATTTDPNGEPTTLVDIPANPPVNHTISGKINNVSDVFTVVLNEHIVNADGSLTVNAVHMYMFGPHAVGEAIKGQVTCGTNPSPLSTDDTVAPTCSISQVPFASLNAQQPPDLRKEYIGVFDAGQGAAGTGLQSITNVQAYNATVQVGSPPNPDLSQEGLQAYAPFFFADYAEFTPGQTGPLQVMASRVDENLPMSWSFDATDVAGNVTHCTGVPYPGPNRFSVADISVTEGSSGTTAATFTVTRTGETVFGASVKYKTSLGKPGADCTGDADYITVPLSTLSFQPDEVSKEVTVQLCGDTLFEANDTFSLVLSTPVYGAIADASGTATILNDDAAATLTVDDPSTIEGGQVQFTVTRSGNTAGTSTVKYKTALGTAIADTDYASVPLNTLTFIPGQSSQTVTTTTSDDATDEANETFNLVLSGQVGAVLSDTAGTATIVDNDGVANPAAPATFLSVADISMNEGSGPGTATFTILRSGDTSGTSTVSYRTTGGNATAGNDYTAIAVTPVTFTAGQDTKTVDVTVLGDELVEVNETFSLALSLPSTGTSIADGAGVATLRNDDGAAYLSVSDVSWPEGNSGTTPFTFTVTRSGNTNDASSASYKTSGGNALPGTDYTEVTSGTVSFAAGQTSKEVTVNVTGDAIREANDTFNLVLTTPVGAALSDAAGMGTILNDEPPPAITIEDISLPEGNSGTTPFVFTITRTGNTTGSSTVSYKTQGSTAGATDFTAKPLTVLSFAAGEASKTVTVNVTGNTVSEPDEVFRLLLSKPTGAYFADGVDEISATATILNDD